MLQKADSCRSNVTFYDGMSEWLTTDSDLTQVLCVQAWCAMGNCFSLQKEHDVAIKFFQRAVQVGAFALITEEVPWGVWDQLNRSVVG